MDGSTVRGNTTVFDGNVVETTAARSVVQLDGAQVTLAPESRAKIYRDRTVLEKGSGLIRDTDKHVFEAESLQVSPAGRDSVVQVDIQGPLKVAVAARSGSVQVRNSTGLLIASLRPGMALAFNPQTGASSAVKLSGMVTVKDGKYFLADPVANITVELRGNDLAKLVGKKVQITGSVIPGATPAPGASEVVQVTESKNIPAGGAVPGGAGGGAGAGAGISTTTTVAIVGGVAVSGTVIGLAAAGTFSGSSTSTP